MRPQKPTSRKYREYKETAPRTGRVPFFNDPHQEDKNTDAWTAYRGWVEQTRRELPGILAETEQGSSRQVTISQPELHALKALADELGIENDISWDGQSPVTNYPFVSRNNPWLDQPPAVKRAKAQSLLARVSNALHPAPDGKDGDEDDGDDEDDEDGEDGEDQGQSQENARGKRGGKRGGKGEEGNGEEGNGRARRAPSSSSSSSSARENTSPTEKLAEKTEQPQFSEFDGPTDGGGAQTYGNQRQESIFLAIRRLLTKLAEETDYSQVTEVGRERWDAKQLVVGKWNPTRLPQAKRDFATRIDHIYFSLDTSGSVDHLTTEIASMAAGAAGLVHLYTGTEGKPEFRVERYTPLHSPGSPFPEWVDQRLMCYALDPEGRRYRSFRDRFLRDWKPLYRGLEEWSFEMTLAWFLEVEKPKPGARLLFWGDTRSVYFLAPRLLAQLVRKYRFAWLFPYSREARTSSDYAKEGPESLIAHAPYITDYEWEKLEAVGLPVLFGVDDAVSIQRAMRELQTRKGH